MKKKKKIDMNDHFSWRSEEKGKHVQFLTNYDGWLKFCKKGMKL